MVDRVLRERLIDRASSDTTRPSSRTDRVVTGLKLFDELCELLRFQTTSERNIAGLKIESSESFK